MHLVFVNSKNPIPQQLLSGLSAIFGILSNLFRSEELAIAQWSESNVMLRKLAAGINFVVGILETLAGGEVLSIAGALSELDSLLG